MHPQLGPTWCQECRDATKPFNWGWPEFTTDEIRDGRKKYRKELLQSHRQGEISKEYLDAYPEQHEALIKEGVATREEIKNAKPVWYNDNL